MKKAISILLGTFVSFAPLPLHAEDDLWESKGPHVRIKRNDQDGSYVVFERSPDDRSLVKTTKNQNGDVKMRATYIRNPEGFLVSGQIHDGQGTLIYRVQYGYHVETGQLVAEQMYDARVKNYYPAEIRDPKTGKRVEMPVRRVYYYYDAEGNQSKAISLVPRSGKSAEEIFRKTKKPLALYGEEENFDPETQSTRPDSPFEMDSKAGRE